MIPKNAKEEEIEIFVRQAKEGKQQGDRLNIQAILEVSCAANEQTYENLKSRMNNMGDALRRLMKDELDEATRLGEARGEARATKKYEAQVAALQEEVAKLKRMLA